MSHIMRRLLSFFRRGRLDDELAEEIRVHLELRQRALMDGGMPPADAEREARRQFGNVMSIRERTRDQWGSVAVAAFLQDVKFGARMLARSPGLSVVVVLTIAFGSFLNGAVFLQLNDTFLRAPDLPNAETLVWLDDGGPRTGGTTYPDYVDYRDRVPAIDLAVFAGGGNRTMAVGGSGDRRSPVSVVLATGNYFRVLQAPAALGRTFDPSEDLPPLGTAVAVLSDAYWQRQFGRDRDVLGRTIQLNFKPFTIVGVMPPNFSGARRPGSRAYTPDVWVPIWCHPLLEPGSTPAARSHDVVGSAVDRPPAGRRRHSAGTGADQCRRRRARRRISRTASRPRARVWRVTDFDPGVLRGQEAAMLGIAGAATTAGDADRLRQCGGPAPGTSGGTPAGGRDPAVARREPGSHRSSVPHRGAGALDRRHRLRVHRRRMGDRTGV